MSRHAPRSILTHYLDSRLVRAGLIVLGVGCGPLFLIIIAASLGLTRDPNPNPIGPGILAMLTFMPGLALVGAGITRQALFPRAVVEEPPDTPQPIVRDPGKRWEVVDRWLASTPGRSINLVLGMIFCVNGASGLNTVSGRGPASMVVLGIALVHCAFSGRIPRWFGRGWRRGGRDRR